MLDYLEDHQVPCGFTEENTKYFNYRDKRVDAIHAITHNDDHPAGDCSHVIDKSIYQIMCFVDEKGEKETKQFYFGNPSFDAMTFIKGKFIWSSIQIQAVER